MTLQAMTLQAIYLLLCASALFSALAVVLARHAVYSALFLVSTMVSIAGLFLLMNAQLAAAFQIIVYAGAIMVLFLFVIMLLNIGQQAHPLERHKGLRLLGLAFAAAFILQMFALLGRFAGSGGFGGVYTLADPKNVDIVTVGRNLQTDYIYAFAMTSVLLLVAMIGAVVMARRHLIQGVYDDTKGNKK